MKQAAKIYLLDKDGSYSAVFSGFVEEENGGYYIQYDDDSSSCIIGYSKGVATVTRTTDPAYTVVLEENTPSPFEILTPFGKIDAVAHPISVKSRKHNDSRTITLIYDLVIGKEKFRHELNLRITYL